MTAQSEMNLVTTTEIEKPDFAKYHDYRLFLRDYIRHLRSRGKYSERKFAAFVGFKSFSFMRMVIAGQRRPSRLSIERIAHGLGLSPDERRYLLLLWHFDQAQTTKERDAAIKAIANFKVDTSAPLKNSQEIRFKNRIPASRLDELSILIATLEERVGVNTEEDMMTIEITVVSSNNDNA